MLFLAVCQFFYQMAFIKCQYMNAYLKKVSKSTNNYSEICDTMESTKYRKYLILSV